MKTACLTILVLLLSADAARAQGEIAGGARDRSGAVIPGAEIVASSGDATYKAVTDSHGRYHLRDLPAGAYTVTASLIGFVSRPHEIVVVADRRTTGPVDFLMCLGALAEVDWIVWPRLEDVWARSDVVAHVRITATGRARGDECPRFDFEDTAQVLEVLKQDAARPLGRAVTFIQTRWAAEPAAYPVGQELIAFLVRDGESFQRTGGPYWMFLINGDRVSSFHSPLNTDNVTPADLLARLRAMAKSGAGRRP